MSLSSVWCICMGVGYPGLAQANRMTMVGRALQATGCKFQVCHLGANPLCNMPAIGTHEGIPYRYYPDNISYSNLRFIRRMAYLRGMHCLLKDIESASRQGEEIVVYSWLSTNPATIWFRACLRRMSIPIIAEMNEWWPGRANHLRRLISVLQSDGLLVISAAIQQRAKNLMPTRRIPLLKVPILTDVGKMQPASLINGRKADVYFFWCGNVSSNLKDVEFMLDIMTTFARKSSKARLVIAGRITGELHDRLQSAASQRNIPSGMLELAGYMPDDQLTDRMCRADGLLLPLWADEERSVCRFPTKLGEYLATGRPVITSPVGSAGSYLLSGPSAVLCPSGDVSAYADALERIIQDPLWADKTGRLGRRVAEEHFDFRTHAVVLRDFFDRVQRTKTKHCVA